MKLKILVILNKIKGMSGFNKEINEFKEYIESKTPYKVQFTFKLSSFDLTLKDFGVYNTPSGNKEPIYGLSGIINLINSRNLVPFNEYQWVIFMYNLNKLKKHNYSTIGDWTYRRQVKNNTEFTEIAFTDDWAKENDIFRVLTHEVYHMWQNRAHRAGIATVDTMDRYDEEYNVYAPNGNRERNRSVLAPYWSKINKMPDYSYLLKAIENLIILLISKIKILKIKIKKAKVQKKDSYLIKWAKAIKSHEGWYVGSRSYRNNNPANARYIGQYGAIGKDGSGFAIFKTYDDGWNYLVKMLKNAATGKSNIYNPEMSLFKFFSIYAPYSDGNDSKNYAIKVAYRIGVAPTTKIKELV